MNEQWFIQPKPETCPIFKNISAPIPILKADSVHHEELCFQLKTPTVLMDVFYRRVTLNTVGVWSDKGFYSLFSSMG